MNTKKKINTFLRIDFIVLSSDHTSYVITKSPQINDTGGFQNTETREKDHTV